MRTLFFSIMLSVLSLAGMSQTYEVTVNGFVTDIDSGEAVEGQMVDIMTDSLYGDFVYYNTVFTDAAGYYEDVIDVTDGASGTMIVSTMSCNEYLSEASDFSESETEIENDFEVCTEPGDDDCQAMFYYYPGDPADFLTIQFMDDSWGDPTSWDWDFGDGETSDEQNPLHTYGAEGFYYVNLTIEGDSGDCSSSVEMMVRVGYDSIPEGCEAWFSYFQTDVPNMLQFVDESWGDPTAWAWDFGDGESSNEQDPAHIYGAEGEYFVTLTISGDSCTSTYEEMVWVGNDTIYPGDCEVRFFYYPAYDSVPDGDLAFQFMDMSSGEPTTWAWDFGDGGTSEEQNPIHTYAEEGEYEVCLTIANPADSCESTDCEEVYIYNDTIGDCFGWFEYTMDDLDVDFEGYLMDSQTGEYTWEFGDSTTGSGQTVSHTYADDGIYTVTMHAVDSAMGCDVEYVEDVWVGDSITFTIYGNVYLEDSVNMADVANVYLMTFDTIGDDLINIATTTIDANGYYEFDGVGFEHCMYFIQAELTDGSAYFGDYVPTYHLDALNWEEAWPVFPYPMGWAYDVYLQPSQGIQSGGGLITGTINTQESRGLLSNVEVLLLHQDGSPFTYLRTDENGEFDFSELSYGTYVVYTEIVGIETSPVTITLSAENPTASINIVVTNGEALLGVGEISSKYIDDVSAVYPNPVTEHSSVNVEMKEPAKVQLTIINQYGQVVFAADQDLPTGQSKMDLNTNSLSPGLYIVSVKANDDIATVRKFVKLR